MIRFLVFVIVVASVSGRHISEKKRIQLKALADFILSEQTRRNDERYKGTADDLFDNLNDASDIDDEFYVQDSSEPPTHISTSPATQPPPTHEPSTQPLSTQPPSTQPPSTQQPSTKPPPTQPPPSQTLQTQSTQTSQEPDVSPTMPELTLQPQPSPEQPFQELFDMMKAIMQQAEARNAMFMKVIFESVETLREEIYKVKFEVQNLKKKRRNRRGDF